MLYEMSQLNCCKILHIFGIRYGKTLNSFFHLSTYWIQYLYFRCLNCVNSWYLSTQLVSIISFLLCLGFITSYVDMFSDEQPKNRNDTLTWIFNYWNFIVLLIFLKLIYVICNLIYEQQ